MNSSSSTAETFGLPVDQASAFSNHKGVFKERLKKQQLKLLKPLAPVLLQFLEPEEKILLAMRGCSPMSFLEQFSAGWIIYYIKRCVLVVTDRRILHIPSDRNYRPRRSLAQIRFGDVEEIKPATFLSRKFTVFYKDSTKETFLQVRDTPKLRAVLAEVRMAGQQPTGYRRRHHLCPQCTAPLTVGEYLCPSCRLEFKNEKKAKTISILVPGGGYFYTGHPFLGVGDAIVETGLIVLVLTALSNLMTNSGDAGALPTIILFGMVLIIEKLYTIYHAKHYVKEYIPVDQEIHPVKR